MTLLRLGLFCAFVLCAGLAEAQETCPVIAVACEVRTTTLLNVRSMPGMSGPLAGAPQVTRAFGIVVDGPVVVNGQTWWKIDYACCADGWSSAAFLKAQAPPPPLPQFEACELHYNFAAGLNVYQQTTPGGPTVKLGPARLSPTTPLPLLFTFPCPTLPGTYYWSLAEVNADGVEGLRGGTAGFIIKAP